MFTILRVFGGWGLGSVPQFEDWFEGRVQDLCVAGQVTLDRRVDEVTDTTFVTL